MIKKILIVLSGIYLILLGAIVVTIFLVSTFSLPEEAKAQIGQFRSFKPFFDVMFTMPMLWPVITGVGIILKKNWARFSLFLLSILAIIIGLFSLSALLMMPSPQNPQINSQVFKLFYVGYLILFIAIPIFFMVFFNNKSVKALFVPKGDDQGKATRPFGITLIALLSFLGVLFCAFSIFKPFIDNIPLFANIILSGKALKLYFLILGIINIYIGIGLLKLRKVAWLIAIFFHGLHLLLGIINILTFSEDALSQINSSFGMDNFSMSLIEYKLSASIGLIYPIIIIIYLYLRRDFFTRPS